MKNSFVKKIILVSLSLFLLSSGLFAEEEKVLTWEDQKLEMQAAKEAKKQEKAAKAAAKEELAEKKIQEKAAKMSDEERAAYLASESEKKAARDAAKAEKEAAAAEKLAAKEAAKAEKEQAAAQKKAEKDAALQEKLAAMTPEQRAKYDEKEALKAKIKADIEADQAMRKATIEATAKKPNLPYMYLDAEYGLELAQITRVVLQNDRSNFVFKDSLVGANATLKLTGFKPFVPLLKVSALLGLGSTFNDMKMTTSGLNFGADLFAGIDYRINFWDYLYLNLAPGFHFLYQSTSRFNYMDLGIGAYASFELPISYEWTVILGGQASYDWGNFGNNALLETYDYVWQYSGTLGVRFSKKHVNKYNYIGDSAELIQIKKDRKAAFKADKKAKAQARKAAAAEAKAAKAASQEQQ